MHSIGQLFRFLLLAVAVLALPVPGWAAGEQRLALVIGNASYKHSPLANPVNDARLMELALKEATSQ